MTCKKCGKEFDGNFCPFCGTRFDAEGIERSPENCSESKGKSTVQKRSKKKIIIISSIAATVLSVFAVFLLFLFNVINIPFLTDLFAKMPSEEKIFDENNIGEVYFHQTDAEHIITNKDGFLYVDNEILLVVSDSAKYTDIEKLSKKYNAEIVGWIEQTGDYQLQIEQNYTYDELEEIASSLKESDFVQDAYVNFAFEMNENKTEDRNGFIYGDEWEKDLQNFNNCKGKSWGIEAIESLAAWDVLDANKKNITPVKVGLIDSAFDTNHEDLGFAETFYNVDSGRDHGTHVAGTIASKSNNQEGICGVYPYGNGNLYGVSYSGVCNYSENGTPFTTSMFLKIAYSELILRNVKVINSSLGFNYYQWPLKYTDPEWNDQVEFLESNAYVLGDFLDRLLDKGYDFVLINAAGNDSNRANGVVYDSKYNFWTTVISEEEYPEVYNRIIVVGAVDSDFNLCDFSNGGDRVDIYAPGDTIFSTIPNSKYENKNWSGTSMAAPHVSGVAAMVWSVNNNLTGAQVKEILCDSHSFRCNSCNMIDAYIALQKATRLNTSSGNSDTKNGGILCWVVSANNVNTKVQNATVTITNIQSGEEFITTTDSFGHFEFFIPAGQYSLSVKAENYEDYYNPNSSFIIVENNSVNYLSDWIKMEPTYSNEDILGTYKGSYFVNKEEIGLTLTVYDEDARYKAIFEFYNLSGKANTESGKYYMDVSYDISNDEYSFVATDWIDQPTDYSTLDLEGKLVGNILSGESPTRFSVTKMPEEADSKVSLEDMPIVAHDSYKDNEGDSTIFNLNGKGLTQCDDGKTFKRYGNIGIDGTVYSDGFEVWIARWNYTNEISWASATFDLGGKYKTLTGKTNLIKSYNTTNFDTTVYFYDGEKLLASYRLTNSDYIKDISVNISGVKHLKLYVKDNVSASGGTSFALYDMFLDNTTLPTPEKDIPSDALEFNGHHYKIYVDACDSWEEAKEYCENLGGHLAVISSKEENDALFSYVISSGNKNAYFGYSDNQEEGNWYWSGDNSSYTNWHKNEPNSERSNEDFAMFYWKYSDGTWNDGNFGQGTVSDDRNFICEWD